MGKKLEANGLWESSRMMLPEHKDATRRQAKQIDRLVRPTLDDWRSSAPFFFNLTDNRKWSG
ncbi:hypothetical protein SAMN05443246_1552 [Paenibacillus sp. GP183]|nr:hypothetical protein SAMN05443246_1552 [Paenibacillus sp. GP183]